MSRKRKEGSVNLYYLKNQNVKNDKSVSKNKTKRNAAQKKQKNKKEENLNENRFNFDDEIVIGVTKIADNKKKSQSKTKSKNVKNKKKNSVKKNKVQAPKKKKEVKTFKIFKYLFLIGVLLGGIVFFMLSPIFNITEIRVEGNNIISSEQIVSLSEIKVGENIYKINKNNTINKVKRNAYIENIEINRKFPSILEINVKERKATYMLEYVNNYAYINNQGYMLEISEQKIERPILTGISTNSENIKPGNRLIEEDLLKLEDVLKIMESATSNEIEKLINKIDLSDKLNYIVYLETEGKSVKLGDVNGISTKMLHIKKILEKEPGIEGEIIVNSVLEDGKSRFIQKINWSVGADKAHAWKNVGATNGRPALRRDALSE